MNKKVVAIVAVVAVIGVTTLSIATISKKKNKLKITTLAENKNEDHKNLKNEFGFSVLIEKGDKKIIFDTAKAGEFIENAKKMNIDISKSDDMVLSHAHYDHCGGVMPYFKEYGTDKTKLYVKNTFFDLSDNKYYHDTVGQKFDFTDGTPGYFPVGINFSQKDLENNGVKVNLIDKDFIELEKDIEIHGNFKLSENDKMAPNMLVKDGDKYILDDFDEEIALSIKTDKGLVIVSGCSHTGILNIVNTIQKRTGEKVYAVIGGFHLLDASDEKIQSTIDRFKELGVQRIGLSHCTGPKATKMFLKQMPKETFVNETGSIFK